MPPWSSAPAARRAPRAPRAAHPLPAPRLLTTWRARAAAGALLAAVAASGAVAAAAPATAHELPLRARALNALARLAGSPRAPAPVRASAARLLRAGAASGGAGSATAAAAAPQPVVVLDTVRSGPNLERGGCLAVGIRPGLAVECGDWRITHALPATRTWNKTRTPVLLYNSKTANPHGTVDATISLPGGVPDQVVTWLHIDGSPGVISYRWWPGSDWGPDGGPRRVSLMWNANGYATGLHTYQLEVWATYGGQDTPHTWSSGETAVVDRTNSWFGGGWWLDGWESLQRVSNNRLLWIGGDGSTRIYTPTANDPNRWASPATTRQDTIVWDGSYYRRYLDATTTSAQVVLDWWGRHYQTIDRLGHATIFGQDGVDSRRLATIVLPVPGGPNGNSVYFFHYDGANKLDGVCAPPRDGGGLCRNTPVSVVNGAVQSITNPDGTAESFRYDGANWAPMWISGLTDVRGLLTTWWWRPGWTFGESQTYHNWGADLIRIAVMFDDERVTNADPNSHALRPDQAVTTVDGARPDVNDWTTYWLDGRYQPTRVVDAVGRPTQIAYDATWPGLPAQVVSASGLTESASYNNRGLATAVTVTNARGDGASDITRYAYDPVYPLVTRTQTPMGLVTRASYDRATGQLRWTQIGDDTTNTTRRTTIGYWPSVPGSANYFAWEAGLPMIITSPTDANGHVANDNIWYDGNGNFSAEQKPGGGQVRVWNYYHGLPYITYTQLDTAEHDQTRWRQDVMTYDAADRVTNVVTSGEVVNGTSTPTRWVATTYDPDGRPRSVRRSQAPDLANLGALVDSTYYDDLGRVVKTVASDGATESTLYDDAGNPTQVTPRRINEFSGPITMQYDALNRLTQRVLPSVTYASRSQGLANLNGSLEPSYPRYLGAESTQVQHKSTSAYTLKGETQTFGYDVTGAVDTAINGDAQVTRTYYPNGLLASETLVPRATLDGTFPASHRYLTSYTYDGDGRRVRVTYPAQISPGGAARNVSFGYDDGATGLLASVGDMLGNSFALSHDNLGQPVQLDHDYNYVKIGYGPYHSHGSTERWGYDVDGQLAGDTVTLGTASQVQRQATFTRNAAGQLRTMQNAQGLRDVQTATYDGLGQAVLTSYTASGTYANGTGAGNMTTGDSLTHDPLGNLVADVSTSNTIASWDVRTQLQSAGNATTGATQRQFSYTYQSGTGRLAKFSTPGKNIVYTYDAAGDVVFESDSAGVAFSDRASFYGADGKLRTADFRVATTSAAGYATYRSVFEEYRYDALGRRIWVRARRTCSGQSVPAAAATGTSNTATYSANEECRISTVRRTVWDGLQEIGEIQMPGSDASPVSDMENDTGALGNQAKSDVTDAIDPNQFFGRVAYTFATGIDQPVGVTRMGLVTMFGPNGGTRTNWPDQTIVPLWNARGQAEDGYVSGQGSCSSQPCYPVVWVAGWFPYNRQFYVPAVWHGSLLEDKADKTGTLYRRNRYYDPSTGRFTQEDPIGLAGGLNRYGFAAGDPVNYSDPFGLCIEDGCVGEFILAGLLTHALVGTQAWQAAKNASGDLSAWFSKAGTSGENAAARVGRAAHKAWDAGAGYVKEFTLPSGKRCDAYNPETCHVKELKPDNERAKKRGEKQVEEYRKELERETEKPHTASVETYPTQP